MVTAPAPGQGSRLMSLLNRPVILLVNGIGMGLFAAEQVQSVAAAKEMLATALCVYPRSRPLRSLYYVASALTSLPRPTSAWARPSVTVGTW